MCERDAIKGCKSLKEQEKRCIYSVIHVFMCIWALAEVENDAASEHTPDVPIKVLYNVLIFPASESKKDDIKKQKGLSSYFKLDSNKPYDTWKAQLLVQISQKLNPSQITYEDYDVSFTVPHICPSPLLVTTDDNYSFLLKHVRKVKEPMANVYVQEKMTMTSHKHKCDDLGSSAEGSDMESSHKKWKKKKTHSHKDTDINEADHPLNKNICALWDHWWPWVSWTPASRDSGTGIQDAPQASWTPPPARLHGHLGRVTNMLHAAAQMSRTPKRHAGNLGHVTQ
ncbi:hypothetical protein EV401DRAFT_1889366 [Pisolithus croceorrhizus]|nr:hypothetical protein EV401DRAFT_1889366 [Pisolithus croceorrhizus]